MPKGPTAYKPRSQFSRAAKIDDAAIIQLVYGFCQGMSLEQAAILTGLSRKSVRAYYQALRERLTKPKFNRWHSANALLLDVPDGEQTALVKAAFFDLMAACHDNAKCFENYSAGKRKSRQCRACPLTGKYANDSALLEAYEMIDAMRSFYRQLGMRKERGFDPVQLFRLRFIHTVTVTTALQNSKSRVDGLADPQDKGFLSVSTLLDVMLEELAEQPL